MSNAPQRVSRAHFHPSPESGFLSRQQVSELFGFSISFLAQLPRADLWYHKVGNKIFYERPDVVAFIRGQGHIAETSAPSSETSRRGRPPKPALKAPRSAATAANTR